MFNVISVKDFIKRPYLYDNPHSVVWLAKKGKNKRSYLQLYCGFDIETYTKVHCGYMYIWQFSIYGKDGNTIIIGRTWKDFVDLIDTLIYDLNLSSERRILIGVANLSFEHQYMKRHFIGRWTKTFAKEKRQPVYAILDDCIEFRDILMITGGSLATLAKEYTTTQKLVGDLDYEVPRNYLTELNEQELQYCYNDVAIVAEFMEYLFTTYIIPEKFIPLTKTGLLRREVKKAMCEHGSGVKRQIMREIYRCYPDNYDIYKLLMMHCFRGGYTHANIRHVDQVVNVRSSDITSSYPYTMLAYDGFPTSPLQREPVSKFWDLYHSGNYCLMFSVNFLNLRAKTDHAIESKSKCVTISNNAIIDNGRIRRASMIEVWLTELDFTIYQMFYEWDSMSINVLFSSVKGRLPRYLLMPLARAYEKKARMKHEGKSGTTEYSLYKSLVNSAFGMCCTRLVEKEIVMSELSCEWYDDASKFDYEKERKKAFLLPQWAIYICAYSRFRILSAIYAIGKDAAYSDTDSLKYVGEHQDYFDLVNAETKKTMKGVCDMYGLDYDLFYDLGSFETEYNNEVVAAKFLGAKRYMIKQNGKYEVTVAGLPKKALQGYFDRLKIQYEIYHYGEYPLDMFELFTDRMLLSADVSMKNAHTYNDTPHRDIINGVECLEMSSVGIYPIDFTLKLSEFYLCLIAQEKERSEHYEDRIY